MSDRRAEIEALREEIEALLHEPIDYGVSIVALPPVLAIFDRFAAILARPAPEHAGFHTEHGDWCRPCPFEARPALTPAEPSAHAADCYEDGILVCPRTAAQCHRYRSLTASTEPSADRGSEDG